jgi:c-di-GMP-binding flagellar brake protein YcgR
MEKINLKIKYGDGKVAKGYILDLSKSGMGIASCVKISKDALVEIISRRPLSLSLKAKVVSISERNQKPYNYRIGAEFVSPGEKGKKNLTNFMLKRERRQLGRLALFRLWKRE